MTNGGGPNGPESVRTHTGETMSAIGTNLPLSTRIASTFISRVLMKMKTAMRGIMMIIANFPTVITIIITFSATEKGAQATACTGINILGDIMIGVRMKRWANGLPTVPTRLASTSQPAEGNSFRGWAWAQANIGVATIIKSIVINGARTLRISRRIVDEAIEPACRIVCKTMRKTMTVGDYVMTTVNVTLRTTYTIGQLTSRGMAAAPPTNAQGMNYDASKRMIIETLIIAGTTNWMTIYSPHAPN